MGKEVNLLIYIKQLWANRKLLIKVAGIAAVIGVIIAFSIPKVYTATVILSPEVAKNSRSSLSNMAAMLGLGNMMGNDANALNITMANDIVSSTPFILELMDLPVQTLDGKVDTTLVGYLASQKRPWWTAILSLPGKAVSGIISLFKEKDDSEEKPLNPFHLTKKQGKQVRSIRRILKASVDKKTGITTIGVSVQDPLVAATLADQVVNKIQQYITKYKVSKAIEDRDYWGEQYKQRQQEYFQAQEKYAKYADENQGIVHQSVRIEQERLQNEVNLSFQMFTQVATQLQMAEAKVQEEKPAFAVLEPATVPLIPSSTSRMMMLIAIVFLAVAGTSAWIILKNNKWETIELEWD